MQLNSDLSVEEVLESIDKALENTSKVFPKQAVVACQGIEGANSMIACESMFRNPDIKYVKTFDRVFDAVAKGQCQYGILPIENSLAGSVIQNYDLMKKYNVFIVNSNKIKIDHFLMAKKGVQISDIKTVYSHPQALAQCSEYLHELGVEAKPCENTAVAAQMVADSDRNDIAALASKFCVSRYGLNVLNENCQNNENNYTRFICISNSLEIYPGAKKISLNLILPNKAGSLANLLMKFAELGINLTKLESRPIPGRNFEFMFYFDLEVSVYDEALAQLFKELDDGTERYELMGCYIES